jgi:hypothetical protein
MLSARSFSAMVQSIAAISGARAMRSSSVA